MITVPIAVIIALAILGLAYFAIRNMHHPLYMHIVAFGLIAILAAFLGFAFLNGDLVSENTVMKNETVTGFTWNVSSNTTASNSTVMYNNAVVLVPIQNPAISMLFFMFATLSGVGFIYSLFVAWDDAAHPKVDPYEVDEGVD